IPSLPENISYSNVSPKAGINIPRRELYDIRMQLMAEDDLSNAEGSAGGKILMGDEDVKTSLYEGGLKSWECSLDLVRYLEGQCLPEEAEEAVKVLELGCGTALPSLFLFQRALEKGGRWRFTLADYNVEVLRLVTLPNLLLSWIHYHRTSSSSTSTSSIFLPADPETETEEDPQEPWEPQGDIHVSPALVAKFLQDLSAREITLEFVSGAWGAEMSVLLGAGYGLVLGSETIYSPRTTPAFAEVLIKALGERGEGRGLVAAKRIYFGVGGGVKEFEGVVRERVGWRVGVVEEAGQGGVGRVVVEVRR
ncbi:hypothetical protein RUND412_008800, partial [Rhizina undulata]